MKRICLLICMGIASLGLSAQSVMDMWVSMPDSIVPYLNSSLRAEMVKRKAAGQLVENLAGDTTGVMLLTDNYIKVQASKSYIIELKLLDAQTMAMVQTWLGSEPESQLWLYDMSWKQKACTFVPVCIRERADTMSVEKYSYLLALLEPKLIWLQLSDKDDSLTAQYSLAMLSSIEKQELSGIIMQRKYNWDGNTFK